MRFMKHQYQEGCRRFRIFLPAAGHRWDTDLNNAGNNGNYWSRSLNSLYSGFAFRLYFLSNSKDWDNDYRCYGQSVRPVCPGK